MNIALSRIEEIAACRKMDPRVVLQGYQVSGNEVVVPTEKALKALSDVLLVPESDLSGTPQAETSDLDAGVRVYRASEGFKRTVERKGKAYYTYQHLATTKDAPELMALKVTLLCDQPESVTLNDGHGSKELIYVIDGSVRMDWDDADGSRHTSMLNKGDSVYLQPGIPHSFAASDAKAEIIAVNYNLA